MNNLNAIYESLCAEPYKFSFVQACFIIEHKVTLFSQNTPQNAPVRLISYNNAKTLHASCIHFDKSRKALILNIPALLGFNGFLPKLYTENIFFSEQQKNFALADFFNIFQHRFFTLKYQLEKTFTAILNKEQFQEIFEICGLNPTLRQHFTPFLGIILMKNKTAQNLKKLLESILKTKIEIKEFQQKYFDIPGCHQLRLDYSLLTNKALGSRTKTNNFSINIVFWFKNFSEYMNYLNDDKKQNHINSIIKYFLNGEIEFNTTFKILEKTTQTFKLNSKNKLGITTWI